ncbi:hypothetical protein FGO68_gene12578 [Halteria grandinella]|uniref:Uncharacterized protein n=1 Tax=Halteria grandinella TaxID=5974 RepID=A0A8J8T9G2_HALGN|nr:hypothetical protein FGO68_gene12578 [Halteria grandinella]
MLARCQSGSKSLPTSPVILQMLIRLPQEPLVVKLTKQVLACFSSWFLPFRSITLTIPKKMFYQTLSNLETL